MQIEHLQQFIDLAGSRHFARTSALHHVSPSTLSRSIQRLEDRLGTRLLERNSRLVELTREGELFLQFASDTVAAWQDMQRQVLQADSELAGELSLFCSVTASHYFLNDILARLRAAYPRIELKLHTGDQAESLERLQRGEDDFVIAAKPSQLPENVAFTALASSRLVCIAPFAGHPGLALPEHGSGSAADTTSLNFVERVQDLPWILAERGLVRSGVEQWFARHDRQPQVYAQVSGHEAIVSMVSLGCGVAVVPDIVLDSSPLRDSIRVLDMELGLPDFEIGLCALANRMGAPLIHAVWDTLSA